MATSTRMIAALALGASVLGVGTASAASLTVQAEPVLASILVEVDPCASSPEGTVSTPAGAGVAVRWVPAPACSVEPAETDAVAAERPGAVDPAPQDEGDLGETPAELDSDGVPQGETPVAGGGSTDDTDGDDTGADRHGTNPATDHDPTGGEPVGGDAHTDVDIDVLEPTQPASEE
jgi:hypothetical protein